ncbi:MAG: BamA/TamA family outer membrane protein [Vicinamibacteria bacterium]
MLALAPGQARAQDPAPSPSPSPAPETRAEHWRRLREEKKAALVPYRPGFLERQILEFEKAERPSIATRNFHGIYPRVAGVSSGSRLAPSLRFWQPDIGGSSVSVHASAAYSLRGYELYDLQAGRLPHAGQALPPRSTKGDDVYELGGLAKSGLDRLILYSSLRYRHNPQDAFFGLGSDSKLEDRTSFLQQDATYEVVGGWQFGRRLVATGRFGYRQVFVGAGESKEFPTTGAVFDDAAAPGLARQPDFWKSSAFLLFDGRDRPFNPHRGGMVGLEVTRYDDRDSTEFAFTRTALDARGYLSLGSPQRVVAVRALVSRDRADDGARVPFYLMEELSDSHRLRGYQTFRYRGERTVALSAEYRWEAAPALELAVFADAGRAFRPEESWSLSDLRGAVGFGIRIKTHDAVIGRLEFARGAESSRLYVRFGPSF